MTVTSKPGNGNKVHVYVDGTYAFTLYDEVWAKAGIAEGSEVSEDELASLREEAGFRSAYEKGLTLLSARAYATRELREKLRLKHGADAADRAIEKLASYGYLDDEAFAADYARYLMERKHFDVRRIALELRRKGVDGETAAKTLKTLDNDPISRIIELLKTKHDGKLEDERERKRLVNRLLRMGYALHDIRAAFAALDLTLPE